MAPSSPAARLSNADFLSRLTTLFTSTHASNAGSVFLTQKPLFPESSSTENAPAPRILIRATDGKSAPPKSKSQGGSSGGVSKKPKKNGGGKIKFSTVVEATDLESFFASYADVCKGGMQGLRKRDRKKAKKKGKGGGGAGGGK